MYYNTRLACGNDYFEERERENSRKIRSQFPEAKEIVQLCRPFFNLENLEKLLNSFIQSISNKDVLKVLLCNWFIFHILEKIVKLNQMKICIVIHNHLRGFLSKEMYVIMAVIAQNIPFM